MILKHPLFLIILIIVVGLIAYSNTFDVPFVFDDKINITDNPFIKNLSYFSSPETAKDFPLYPYFKSRFIGYLTFALNYKIHGLDVRGYHIFNLAVHLINALLVYLLVLLTFKNTLDARLQPAGMTAEGTQENPPSPPFAKGGNYIALFSALLFVAHPLQTQAVTYIVQRFTSLATMFYLASLVLYIKSRLEEQRFKSLSYYLLCIISAILAMKTKEIAFTLPIIIVLYEFMFFDGGVKKRLVYLLPILFTMLIIPFSFVNIDKPIGEIIGAAGEASRVQTQMSRWDYLFTQFRVIVTYLRLLVFPINQNLDYDYPVYNSFFNPEVFLSFLLLVSILLFGIYMYKRNRLVSFGIFWFFITLSVESSVIPIADVIYEHRVYLPSIGVFITVVSGIFFLTSRKPKDNLSKCVLICFASASIFLVGATYNRNLTWQSDISLLEDVVSKSPNKVRTNYNLGEAYHSHGMIDNAIIFYKKTLSLDNSYADASNNLGLIYMSKGLTDTAIEYYLSALKYRPYGAEIHNNLGIAYGSKGMNEEAIRHYLISLEINPYSANTHFNLGFIYFVKGDFVSARKGFEISLQIDPGYSKSKGFLRHMGIQYN